MAIIMVAVIAINMAFPLPRTWRRFTIKPVNDGAFIALQNSGYFSTDKSPVYECKIFL